MQIRRLGVSLHSAPSAPRELFCYWRGSSGPTLLATLDITIWDDGEGYQPQPVGTFTGAVVETGFGKLGTIASYPFPFSGKVAPLVNIDPDPGLELDALRTWDQGSVVPAAELVPGVGVVVAAHGGLHGRIDQSIDSHYYPDRKGNVQSIMLSDLPTFADRSVYGAPVVLESEPRLLVGMLLTGESDSLTAKGRAQCFPACLIQ